MEKPYNIYKMDRKEFLKTLWYKFFKPLILLGVLIFSVRFLIRIFTQNDTERLIAIIVLGLVILSSLMYLIGVTFTSLKDSIISRLSEKTLNVLRILGKVLDYILPIAFGMITYHSWQEGATAAVGFFGVILILQIIEIVKKEKLATTLNKPH
jgi:hypothetical protein